MLSRLLLGKENNLWIISYLHTAVAAVPITESTTRAVKNLATGVLCVSDSDSTTTRLPWNKILKNVPAIVSSVLSVSNITSFGTTEINAIFTMRSRRERDH